MNRRLLYAPLIVLVLVSLTLTGCNDRLDLEDAAFSLTLGIDLDEQDKLIVYTTNSVFSRDVKKKSQRVEVKAETLRLSRELLDAHTAGAVLGRKTQILIVGKRILQHEGWFSLLEPYFRDSRNTVTMRVVAVDGPVRDIIYDQSQDKPLLSIFFAGLIDTKSNLSETVRTTLQELHRQMFEKGETPYISEIKKNKEIALTGTTLLDHKGRYALSLNMQETALLRIVQKSTKKSVSISYSIPGEQKQGPFHTDKITFNSERIKTKIKTSYNRDNFQFDINIRMPIALTERLFPFDVDNNADELEKMIAKQVKNQLEELIKKIQKQHIDPIGLGLYARAYEYNQYKKVEDHWGEALAKAQVNVAVKVKITMMGPVQ